MLDRSAPARKLRWCSAVTDQVMSGSQIRPHLFTSGRNNLFLAGIADLLYFCGFQMAMLRVVFFDSRIGRGILGVFLQVVHLGIRHRAGDADLFVRSEERR